MMLLTSVRPKSMFGLFDRCATGKSLKNPRLMEGFLHLDALKKKGNRQRSVGHSTLRNRIFPIEDLATNIFCSLFFFEKIIIN